MSNAMTPMRVVRGISLSLCIVLLLLNLPRALSAKPRHRVRILFWFTVLGRMVPAGKAVYDIPRQRRLITSVSSRNRKLRLKDDVAATKRALALQDGPCILVAHSYGGP